MRDSHSQVLTPSCLTLPQLPPPPPLPHTLTGADSFLLEPYLSRPPLPSSPTHSQVLTLSCLSRSSAVMCGAT